ncbi:MAG: hypothetical protein FJW90_04305, partial [Actinobacteria bacterium]|nr:hypothetical protein [Actinomycetota bacterium]
MSGRDAYEDEMAFLRRLSLEDPDAAEFALLLRRALPQEPSGTLTATIVPRLAQAARGSANGAG